MSAGRRDGKGEVRRGSLRPRVRRKGLKKVSTVPVPTQTGVCDIKQWIDIGGVTDTDFGTGFALQIYSGEEKT